MNLPNKLTVARCIMAVIFVGIMSYKHVLAYSLAYLLFIAAMLTDYYDGKIARAYNLVTNFGKLFDPVADKVLMAAALIMLMTIPDLRIPGWTIVAIFSREFLVLGARSLAAAQGTVIAANEYGKAKTIFQMIYVLVFLFLAIVLELLEAWQGLANWLPGGPAIYQTVIGLASRYTMVAVALYTVYSGLQFARMNWESLHLDGAT